MYFHRPTTITFLIIIWKCAFLKQNGITNINGSSTVLTFLKINSLFGSSVSFWYLSSFCSPFTCWFSFFVVYIMFLICSSSIFSCFLSLYSDNGIPEKHLKQNLIWFMKFMNRCLSRQLSWDSMMDEGFILAQNTVKVN